MYGIPYTTRGFSRAAADAHAAATARRQSRFYPFSCSAAIPYLPAVLGSAVAVIAIIFLLCFIFVENIGAVSVSNLTWCRTIDVERNTLCTEEGWHVPSGGEVVSSWRAVYDYDTVCIGSGDDQICFTTPNYETRYRYTIWRWIFNRTTMAEGAGTKPEWPVPQLEASIERLGQRKEEYRVWCKDTDGKLVSVGIPYKSYTLLEKGNTVLGVFNVFGRLRRVELLESAD